MPEFKSSATLQCSAESLRNFLGQTANLPGISDPDLSLEIMEAPEFVTEDAVIEFRISAYGFKQRMSHRYVEVSSERIVAEQVDGPTRSWRHTQTITSNDDGTSTLTDEIVFEPPGGMLGYVMTAAKIEVSLKDGMAYRYETLAEHLEA
jgi:ligand-binding SRPBCC domain-containing protein